MRNNRKKSNSKARVSADSRCQSSSVRGKSSRDVRDDATRYEAKRNDPSWYGSGTPLIRDAARINFTQVMGLELNMRGNNVPPTPGAGTVSFDTSGFEDRMVPGVMTLYTSPSFGYSVDRNSSLNLASQATYAYVRHANSGSRNYDATDLGIALLAYTSVLSFVKHCERVYAAANLYSVVNRYVPRTLVEALGVNFDSVINNLANYRYRLNAFIAKASTIAVPSSMSIYARHAFLYQDVYTEGNSAKDQLYAYVPWNFLKFELNHDVPESSPSYGSGMLKPLPYGYVLHDDGSKVPRNVGYTVDELFNMGDEMLDAILQQEDFGIITGDILKAFGGTGIIQMQQISDSLSLTPIYDAGVLYQIKNATIARGYLKITEDETLIEEASITQEISGDGNIDGYLKSQPHMPFGPHLNTNTGAIWSGDQLLVSDTPMPTEEEVLESTRLHWTIDTAHREVTDGHDWIPIRCGSEIVCNTRIYTSTRDLSGSNYIEVGGLMSATTAATTEVLREISVLSNFKYHPSVMYKFDPHLYRMFDIDNYTVQSADVINRIHDAALLNMMAVPTIAGMLTSRRQ